MKESGALSKECVKDCMSKTCIKAEENSYGRSIGLYRKHLLAISSIVILVIAFFFLESYQDRLFIYVKSTWHILSLYYSQHPFWFSFCFILLHIAVVTLFIPASTIMMLLAGAILGFLPGLVAITLANTAGDVLNFLIARGLMQNFVRRTYMRYWERINSGLAKDGWFYLLLLRMSPITPSHMVNVVLGVTGFNLNVFFWVTLFGSIPMVSFYVFIGTKLSTLHHIRDILSPQLLFASLAALLLMIVLKLALKSRTGSNAL